MVKSCSVFGCTNRANQAAKERNISFFKFPEGKHKRRSWIKSINRKNWQPTVNSYVCSEHFVTGWHSDERDDIDYSPTVFRYKKKTVDERRHERVTRRDLSKNLKEAAVVQEQMVEDMLNASVSIHSYCMADALQKNTDERKTFENIGVQCEDDPLLEENLKLREEIHNLRSEVKRLRWGVDKIKDDDKATRFYTGLPSFAVFLWLFNYLLPKAEKMTFWGGKNSATTDRQRPMKTSVPLIDQFLAVMIRLKVGLFVQDISDRFCISKTTFSNMFVTWICLLYEELKLINVFPSKELVKQTTPSVFKPFKNVRIILDCTEIFIQRSSSLINQNLTFSNYKHHNTLKFLIGITPSGVISFVSEAWGGRISDRQIVIESGLLDLLEPGDNVMADKGFTIADLLKERLCTLNIPPFKGKSNQFTIKEVFETQEIAQVRIHVERSIGRVKNFHLFDGVLHFSLAPIASKCFQVACWLTNFDVPLVTDSK
ncbi:uncharacterized protein [Argopecten irradians]|uniref:uncharacterized protein isoform X1 n=2 Tax=Argopecten irradians TaxID=31199 RepID=UPI00371CE469